MAPINFTRKGLNQQIFSSKAVRATKGAKSTAFRGIMENKTIKHVMDKAGERRVFYDALKKRGSESSRGITRNVLKKVLGDVEHSGQFSHSEMHHLGQELIGGSAGSRIIRDHSKPAPPQPVHGSPMQPAKKSYTPTAVHAYLPPTSGNPAQSRQPAVVKQQAGKKPLPNPVAQNHSMQSAPAQHFNVQSNVHLEKTTAKPSSPREHEQAINHFGVREDSEKSSRAKDIIARITGNRKSDNHGKDVLDKAA